MGKGAGVVVGLIMVAVLFVIFPIVMTSTHELQTDEYIQTEADVTTDVAVTTADVVLTKALWDADVAYVTSVTSDLETDVPVADSYVAGTKTLTVSGLTVSETRTLVITHEYDGLTTYTGMGALVAIAPLLLFIAVLGVVIGGLYGSFKGR